MTSRDRRALIAGAAIVIAGMGLLRGAPWMVRSATDRWRRLEAESALLARTEAELAGASRLEDSAKAVKAALAGLPAKLLAGRTETDAAADLAGRIGRESTIRRVRLDRTDVVPDSVRAGWLRRVTISAQFEGDSRGIAGLLAGLANGSQVVVVERVRVVAASEAPAEGPERLRLELVAQGWYLGEERLP
jgi:hypothetical protein